MCVSVCPRGAGGVCACVCVGALVIEERWLGRLVGGVAVGPASREGAWAQYIAKYALLSGRTIWRWAPQITRYNSQCIGFTSPPRGGGVCV